MSDEIQLTDDEIEFLEKHSLEEIESMEQLEKGGSHKCVRCSNTVSTKGGRCASCLKKLRTAKKTPGHWQRAQTKADDALRRQKGKNGTAHKKSSGLGNRASIVKQVKNAEKKTGQKLSPDRKDNDKGYASSNTRMVPEKLNRGRHKVDPKKLAQWRQKMKKNNMTTDDLKNLILAKIANEDQEIEFIKALIEIFDVDSIDED